jgi:hypothetical protein
MAQHFLLSAAARSLSPGKVMRMSERGAENVFVHLRWPQTDGKPVCPRCGCQICYGKPYLSTATWILTPLIFFPPSMPRSKQLGAERQDRLSITTALGSGASPQARRQSRCSRPSSRRQWPSRVQRANSP